MQVKLGLVWVKGIGEGFWLGLLVKQNFNKWKVGGGIQVSHFYPSFDTELIAPCSGTPSPTPPTTGLTVS